MKKFITAIVALFVLAPLAAKDKVEEMDAIWNRGNTAYVNADYNLAIETYDSIVMAGFSSARLYYNLGNACFRAGQMGPAILNYNRALLLNPSDRDVKHNLQVANAQIVDKIDELPEFFISRWMRTVRTSFSSNVWAVVSLLTFALALTGVLLYLLSRSMTLRKLGFYGALVMLVLAVFAVSFSVQERNDLIHSSQAIVMSTAAAVKSSPDAQSKDIFVLHEGTKVNIDSELNDWYEITIADGNKGWIQKSAVETIR